MDIITDIILIVRSEADRPVHFEDVATLEDAFYLLLNLRKDSNKKIEITTEKGRVFEIIEKKV